MLYIPPQCLDRIGANRERRHVKAWRHDIGKAKKLRKPHDCGEEQINIRLSQINTRYVKRASPQLLQYCVGGQRGLRRELRIGCSRGQQTYVEQVRQQKVPRARRPEDQLQPAKCSPDLRTERNW